MRVMMSTARQSRVLQPCSGIAAAYVTGVASLAIHELTNFGSILLRKGEQFCTVLGSHWQ